MKKLLFTLGLSIVVFASFFVPYAGFHSFFNNVNSSYDMQTVKVSITETEEREGRNPCLSLYSNDSAIIYEISSVWYSKFNLDAFKDSFISGKEYTITVDNNEIEHDPEAEIVYVYGMADGDRVYLLPDDAISSDRTNSIVGLIVGLVFLVGIMVLVVSVLLNRKAVFAFLKEFYGRK